MPNYVFSVRRLVCVLLSCSWVGPLACRTPEDSLQIHAEPPAAAGRFDAAAATARTAAIDLDPCRPREDRLVLVFHFLGDGTLDLDRLLPEAVQSSQTTACVRKAFSRVKIPAFTDDPEPTVKTIRWSGSAKDHHRPPTRVEQGSPGRSEPPGRFDAEAARSKLRTAAQLARACKTREGPTGGGTVEVRFREDGTVDSGRVLNPRFERTLAEWCVLSVFGRIRIPPFQGDSIPLVESFEIPN